MTLYVTLNAVTIGKPEMQTIGYDEDGEPIVRRSLHHIAPGTLWDFADTDEPERLLEAGAVRTPRAAELEIFKPGDIIGTNLLDAYDELRTSLAAMPATCGDGEAFG